MAERQVTLGKETFRLPEPFLVMATQNPIEQEGTYPLPEAQVDRFWLKVIRLSEAGRRKENHPSEYHGRISKSKSDSES